MKSMKIIAVMMVVSFLFTGCGNYLGYIDTTNVIDVKDTMSKDYSLTQSKSAYVGSTMIRVKNYKTIVTSTDEMLPSEDFIFNTDGTKQFYFTKNDIFKIKGSWSIDNEQFKAVLNPKMGLSHLLVKEDGTIHNKIVNIIPFGIQAGEAVTAIYTYEYKPTTVKLNTVTSTKNEIEKGKVNYELIYTGANKDSFMLTYREYTTDDLARVSFFQNLTYPKDSKQIRFRDLLIRIESIDGEKIIFTVLQDIL